MDETKRNSSLTAAHLANERTFLAWQRTAIAMMGFGIVIAKLKRTVLIESSPYAGAVNEWHLGSFLVLGGLLSAVFAATRYFQTQKHIESGEYAPNNMGIIISAGVCVIVAVIMLVFLLTTGNTA